MKTTSTTTRRKTGPGKAALRSIPGSTPAPPIRISISIRPPTLSERDRHALALGRKFYEILAQTGGDYAEAAGIAAGVARSIDRLAPGEAWQRQQPPRATSGRGRTGKGKP